VPQAVSLWPPECNVLTSKLVSPLAAGWPILNFAFFAKFRTCPELVEGVGMLDAGATSMKSPRAR
jgi:hypothetical protein